MGSRAVHQLRDVGWYRMACLAFCLTASAAALRSTSSVGADEINGHQSSTGRYRASLSHEAEAPSL
jgi:hypothetical protein